MALADALNRRGTTSTFLINGDETTFRLVAPFPYKAHLMSNVAPGTDDDMLRLHRAAVRQEANAVVVDSYYATARYLTQLRQKGLFVAAIDDMAGYSFPCQVVVNFGPDASQLSYTSSSGDTTFLLGPQYALLSPEFSRVQPRIIRDEVKNVLLTVGGSDQQNLIPRLLRLIDGFAGDFDVTVIIGPFFTNQADVERVASECHRHVRLQHYPQSVSNLMFQADIAISGGGQTLYELVATGTPTIALQVAENQARNLRDFAANNALLFAARSDAHDLSSHIREAFRTLISSTDKRMRLSEAAKLILDGRGPERVAMALTTRLSGGAHGTREASMNDQC
jgi:UDP-2,4-diacetamido-2,4,6-trideoxy-beta-L-altropyranose hydrolase